MDRVEMKSKYTRYDRTFPGLGWERRKDLPAKIYVLVDPRDYTVRYVGQTLNEQQRRAAHRNPCMGTNAYFARWKVALFDAGTRPLMAVVDSATVEQCYEAEARWISYYRGLGELLNAQSSQHLIKQYWEKVKLARMAAVTDQTRKKLREFNRRAWACRQALAREELAKVDAFLSGVAPPTRSVTEI